jgi:tetratricopeptide (TPR) repeat protein
LLVGAMALGLLLLGGLGEKRALAQLTPQQKQEMRQHYERASRAYDVGKYQEAIEEYQKAYEIGADPPMLYNIAQAYRLSDQPAEALRMYKRYLQRAPNAKNREVVEQKIADLEKLLEDRKKAGINAPPVTTSPPPVAPLQPPPAPPPGPPVVSPPPSEPAPRPAAAPARSGTLRIVAWSLVGLGAVVGGAAGYEAWLGKEKADKIDSQSRSQTPVVFDPAVEENGHRANLAATILGITSAAALAGGVVLLVLTRTPAEAATPAATAMLSPWVGKGTLGAGATLHF